MNINKMTTVIIIRNLDNVLQIRVNDTVVTEEVSKYVYLYSEINTGKIEGQISN
jgi:hypothetical protein